MAESSVGDFRQVYLPYALQQLADGSYLPVNRRYKPLGVTSGDFVDYEACKAGRVRVTPAMARKLDVHGVGDLDGPAIYLYDDSSNPEASKAAWDAYAARLAVLSKAKVQAA